MVLYVDTSGYPKAVEDDLGKIVNGDNGGLSNTAIPGDTTEVQIIFNQSSSGCGQNLINALVNKFNDIFVVVTGVDNTFILEGKPITDFGGRTYDLTVIDNKKVIRIIYDTSQCGGKGYFVFDTGGNHIPDPGYIMLGHESSHAFHKANGDEASDKEVQAETDENSLRAQNQLPLRDVNNHEGGCQGFIGREVSTGSCFTSASGDLEIADVQISSPKIVKPEIKYIEQQQWVDIAITVENHSNEKTYYAISSLRSLRYDTSKRTLYVGLCEPKPIPKIQEPHKFPPKLTPVLAGQSAVLKVSIPLVFKEISPSDGLAMNIETFDISDLEHINCKISFSETKFGYANSDSAEQMIKKLRTCGKTIDKMFDRKISVAGKDKQK